MISTLQLRHMPRLKTNRIDEVLKSSIDPVMKRILSLITFAAVLVASNAFADLRIEKEEGVDFNSFEKAFMAVRYDITQKDPKFDPILRAELKEAGYEVIIGFPEDDKDRPGGVTFLISDLGPGDAVVEIRLLDTEKDVVIGEVERRGDPLD
mgnify:CR=1 FL=1